jgi:E3 ubiquitin-protein ligase MARCH6
MDAIFESNNTYTQEIIIPTFANLGRRTRMFGMHIVVSWTKHALGNSAADQIFAVLLGYAVFAVLLSVYLNILTIGSMRSAGNAVRQTVRNQLLVAKVCQFSPTFFSI